MRFIYLAMGLVALTPSTPSFANLYPNQYPSLQDYAGAEICQVMTFDSAKRQCLGVVSKSYLLKSAADLCMQMTFDSEKLSCLEKTSGHEFEDQALRVCSNMTFSSSKNSCVETVADHSFDPAALDICAGMTFESQRLLCLAESAQPMYRPHPQARTQEEVLKDILVDAIDIFLRDILAKYGTGNGSLCRVENSHGSFIGQVPQSQFLNAAKDFARSQNSCVVAGIKGVTRARMLLSRDGTVLRRSLTEKEASDWKRAYGLESCRVITCERL